MKAKFLKDTLRNTRGSQKPDLYIPPIAGTLFGLLLIGAILASTLGSGSLSDGLIRLQLVS